MQLRTPRRDVPKCPVIGKPSLLCQVLSLPLGIRRKPQFCGALVLCKFLQKYVAGPADSADGALLDVWQCWEPIATFAPLTDTIFVEAAASGGFSYAELDC